MAFGTPTIHPTAWVHPTAVIIGNVTLEEDVSVWPGAVLRGDVESIHVGRGSNVQDGALIGIGAVVLNGAVVGMGTLVAAGAVVGEGRVLPSEALVAGVPAKVMRALTEEQRARVSANWRTYVALKERYRGVTAE